MSLRLIEAYAQAAESNAAWQAHAEPCSSHPLDGSRSQSSHPDAHVPIPQEPLTQTANAYGDEQGSHEQNLSVGLALSLAADGAAVASRAAGSAVLGIGVRVCLAAVRGRRVAVPERSLTGGYLACAAHARGHGL